MKTQSTPTLAAVDQPRLVRVYQFEMWNRNGGHIGPIRAIAPNMKEARSIVKAAAPAWIIRNGKRLPDCYANGGDYERTE
jgi:hypothetical protein